MHPLLILGVGVVYLVLPTIMPMLTHAQDKSQGVPRIERLDPALDRLIATDAKIETLGEGYDWSEGPVWVKNGGYLLFSDIPKNIVHRWKQGEGVRPYLQPSGYTGKEPRGGETGSNGLIIDAQGRLVLCQHGDRRVARMDAPLDNPKPQFTTLADRYRGQTLQQPQRRRVPQQRRSLFHRSGVRHGEAVGRSEAGDSVCGRLPPHGLRRSHADDEGDDPAERHRVLAGRETCFTSRSPIRTSAIWRVFDVKADGTFGEGRVLLDVTRWRSREPRTARRPQDRYRRQPVRHRPGRRAGDLARASTSARSSRGRRPPTSRSATTAARFTSPRTCI